MKLSRLFIYPFISALKMGCFIITGNIGISWYDNDINDINDITISIEQWYKKL